MNANTKNAQLVEIEPEFGMHANFECEHCGCWDRVLVEQVGEQELLCRCGELTMVEVQAI